MPSGLIIERGVDLLPRLYVESFLKRYGTGKRRDNIAPVYTAMLAEAARLAAPAFLYAEFPVEALAALDGLVAADAVAVRLAVCTLGPQLDARVRALFPDDPPAAVVLDEIGVALVSALALEIHRRVKTEVASRRLKAGPPFRPGVGRWPLELQRMVFDNVPAGEVGVVLDEALVMSPVKSTSLIISLHDRAAHGRTRKH